METLINLLSKYSFGNKFKLGLRYLAFSLVLFHFFVLLSPFLSLFQASQIENIQNINDPVSNISLAVILMLLVVEGQGSFHAMVKKNRDEGYDKIKEEIIDWLTGPNSKSIFSEEYINPESEKEQEALRNFKVIGNYEKLKEIIGDPNLNQDVKEFCEKVHFEFTQYPSEILYGVHIELNDYELSTKVYHKLNEIFAFDRQCADYQIDKITPKVPSWVFLVKLVQFESDIESNFPKVLTEARHFVELVCHAYDYVYSEEMILEFVKLKSEHQPD